MLLNLGVTETWMCIFLWGQLKYCSCTCKYIYLRNINCKQCITLITSSLSKLHRLQKSADRNHLKVSWHQLSQTAQAQHILHIDHSASLICNLSGHWLCCMTSAFNRPSFVRSLLAELCSTPDLRGYRREGKGVWAVRLNWCNETFKYFKFIDILGFILTPV